MRGPRADFSKKVGPSYHFSIRIPGCITDDNALRKLATNSHFTRILHHFRDCPRMKTNILIHWAGSILQVFFPNSCRACLVRISEGRLLCAPCLELLMECVIPECEWPGRTPLGRMVTGHFYYRTGSPIRSIHRAAKFQADPDATRLLGELLGSRLRNRNCFPDIESCVPVPSHRTKIRARGINSTREIATHVASVLGVPCETHLLSRPRLTASQSDVSGDARAENVRGVFRAHSGKIKRVLLIDDVLTTGSTLDEAARVLEEKGYDVSLAVVAFRREMFRRTRKSQPASGNLRR